MNRPRALVTALLCLLAAGCSTPLDLLVQPPDLYRLTPNQPADPGGSTANYQLLIELPTTAAALDTSRIALAPGPQEISYYADVTWVDRVPNLVQSAIMRGFEQSGRVRAVALATAGVRGDFALRLTLYDFQSEYGPRDDAPSVVMALNAKLVRLPRRDIVASREFTATSPVVGDEIADVVAAFDAVVAETTAALIDWTVREAGDF